MVSFPIFSSGYLIVCSGDIFPAPRVVVAILRDEAMASLSKGHSYLAGRDHSADGWGQRHGTHDANGRPLSFRTENDMYLSSTLSFLQAVFTALTTTPSTPTIDPTSTFKEPSNSTLDNMTQSSQSSITESLKEAQFTKGMRSDTPFHFTESRMPVVKVTKKSRENPPVSTRCDVQLSESQLQPSRSPGHHYHGERHYRGVQCVDTRIPIAVEAASSGVTYAFPAGSRENFRDCPDEHADFATANSATAFTITVVEAVITAPRAVAT